MSGPMGEDLLQVHPGLPLLGRKRDSDDKQQYDHSSVLSLAHMFRSAHYLRLSYASHVVLGQHASGCLESS